MCFKQHKKKTKKKDKNKISIEQYNNNSKLYNYKEINCFSFFLYFFSAAIKHWITFALKFKYILRKWERERKNMYVNEEI